MRYFLIDRVTELVRGERARGVKCVTLSDPILHDHFPDHPILPGALIVEAGAQLGGFLLEMTLNQPDAPLRRALMMQIKDARFHDMARPGDRLELVATIDGILDAAARVKVEVTREDTKVARAELTYSMQEIDSQRVHDQRRYLYELWTKDTQIDGPIL